jgi:hypothetical protein
MWRKLHASCAYAIITCSVIDEKADDKIMPGVHRRAQQVDRRTVVQLVWKGPKFGERYWIPHTHECGDTLHDDDPDYGPEGGCQGTFEPRFQDHVCLGLALQYGCPHRFWCPAP